MANRDLSAYRDQHDSIREEFKKQAAGWGKNQISPHLQWVVERLGLQPHFEVLDVAAGTGLLSRAISPRVRRVVALDITPEMLAEGLSEARRQGITNISFEQGAAEDLSYPTASFDMVVTRFSVHHFKSPDVVIREMCRVCRQGGKLVVIDIVSSEDKELAARYNEVERLRDSSHTQALSPSGLKNVIEDAGVKMINYYSLEVENSVDDWLDFTDTEAGKRQHILELMQRELEGVGETGMRPFFNENKLMFMHTWGIIVGEKREASR
jgi:2-polyprenyl-3-methyl-5-hydroxy-6-metoxy-1,4-benzoquinol methylase